MTDRGDAVVVTWHARGRGQRLTFEPRSDGRWDRSEAVRTKGGDWRTVGTEIVDRVAVEA